MSRSPRAEAILGSAPDEQIAAAIAAEKWARAADLLEFHGERLLLDGGGAELARWLEALPDEYVTRHAKVAGLFAWVRIYDQRYQDALGFLSKAERALQQLRIGYSVARDGATSDEVELRPFAELEQSLAAIRLHLMAVSGGATGKLPGHVEDILIPASGDHPLWRAAGLVILGRSRYLAGDLRGAGEDLEAAHVLASSSRGARAERIAADAGVLLGRIAEARGKLEQATRTYDGVLAASKPRPGASDPSAGPRLAAEVGLARVALARLDLAKAAPRLEVVRAALAGLREAAARPGATAVPDQDIDPVRVVLEGELACATLYQLEGRHEEARAVLDQIDKTLAILELRWPLALIGATRARYALLRKDESGARRWLQQYAMRSQPGQPPTHPIAAFEVVTEALVQAALHQPKPALRAAGDALAFAEASGNKLIAIEAQVALALAHYGAAAREDAKSALVAALEGARAMGGAILPLFVRGIDVLAAELGVESAEIARVAASLPVVPTPQRERADRPASRPTSPSGPIETNQLLDKKAAVQSAEPEPEQSPSASTGTPSGEGDAATQE